MKGTNRFTSIVLVLIVLVYGLQFGTKVHRVAVGEQTCVCAYDGFGYYMYLPQLFQHGNLEIEQPWAQQLQNTYCDSIPAYQLYNSETGYSLDIYHMGLAFVELPAYAIADLVAKAGGYPQDGFSKPYHIAFLLNAFLFVVLGAIFLLKLMRLLFSERVVAVLLLVVFFGTNYYTTTTVSYTLQHHYLFTVVAAMSYYLLLAVRNKDFYGRHFYIAVLLFGLCTVIRPTHALLGLFAFILMWKALPSRCHFMGRMLWFVLSAGVWNIPQLLYWKVLGGSWIMLNMHVEELIIIDPHLIDFLFSFRKGWLVYTPVFLLLIPGFMALRRADRSLFWSLLATSGVFIWIMSSWECWWYAASFGSRVMIDLYPLLLLPLGYLLERFAESTLKRTLIYGFLIMTFVLNLFQSWQFEKGILHMERMSADHYWYIFGKINKANYNDHRLLIDRKDTTWVQRVASGMYTDQRIQKSVLFQSKKPMKAFPGEDLSIAKFPFFGPLKTDETLIEAELEYSTSDSTQSSILRLETVSKFNCYGWDRVELSRGKEPGKQYKLRFKFNLPDIHHRKDKLQVYIDNDQQTTVTVYNLRLTAYSLVRD